MIKSILFKLSQSCSTFSPLSGIVQNLNILNESRARRESGWKRSMIEIALKKWTLASLFNILSQNIDGFDSCDVSILFWKVWDMTLKINCIYMNKIYLYKKQNFNWNVRYTYTLLILSRKCHLCCMTSRLWGFRRWCVICVYFGCKQLQSFNFTTWKWNNSRVFVCSQFWHNHTLCAQ